MAKLAYVGTAFVVLLVMTLTLTPAVSANVVADCYEVWSRCSGWSKGLSGILWRTCDDQCKKKFRKKGGRCVKVKSKCPLSKEAYQCQCY